MEVLSPNAGVPTEQRNYHYFRHDHHFLNYHYLRRDHHNNCRYHHYGWGLFIYYVLRLNRGEGGSTDTPKMHYVVYEHCSLNSPLPRP